MMSVTLMYHVIPIFIREDIRLLCAHYAAHWWATVKIKICFFPFGWFSPISHSAFMQMGFHNEHDDTISIYDFNSLPVWMRRLRTSSSSQNFCCYYRKTAQKPTENCLIPAFTKAATASARKPWATTATPPGSSLLSCTECCYSSRNFFWTNWRACRSLRSDIQPKCGLGKVLFAPDWFWSSLLISSKDEGLSVCRKRSGIRIWTTVTATDTFPDCLEKKCVIPHAVPCLGTTTVEEETGKDFCCNIPAWIFRRRCIVSQDTTPHGDSPSHGPLTSKFSRGCIGRIAKHNNFS